MKHPRNRAERLEINRIRPRRSQLKVDVTDALRPKSLKAVGEDHEIEIRPGLGSDEVTQPVA